MPQLTPTQALNKRKPKIMASREANGLKSFLWKKKKKKKETWKFHENQVFQQLHEQRIWIKEDT